MDYAPRIAAVQAAGIAIWDVFATCERARSLDSAIREARCNDLRLPGRKSRRRRHGESASTAAWRPSRIREVEAMGFEAMVLPSTSPAHAGMSLEQKLAAWQAALAPGF
jgi:hypoxanthine-DNA glycosylase